MIKKQMLAGAGALALIVMMAVTPAQAVKGCAPTKNGIKGCKNEISACVTATCTGLTGKPKRQCKAMCKNDTKTACAANTSVCTGSPNAAFLRN